MGGANGDDDAFVDQGDDEECDDDATKFQKLAILVYAFLFRRFSALEKTRGCPSVLSERSIELQRFVAQGCCRSIYPLGATRRDGNVSCLSLSLSRTLSHPRRKLVSETNVFNDWKCRG